MKKNMRKLPLIVYIVAFPITLLFIYFWVLSPILHESYAGNLEKAETAQEKAQVLKPIQAILSANNFYSLENGNSAPSIEVLVNEKNEKGKGIYLKRMPDFPFGIKVKLKAQDGSLIVNNLPDRFNEICNKGNIICE